MPFQSEKQRRYLWANEPEIARDWTDRYGAAGGGIMRLGFYNGGPGPGGQGARGQATQNPGRAPSRSGPDTRDDRFRTQRPQSKYTAVQAGTLSDPREKKDYFEQSWTGPSRFLGLGGGYKNLNVPGDTAGGHQSRFGLGSLLRGAASMFGGIPGRVGSMLSRIDPRQLRGINSLGRYNTQREYEEERTKRQKRGRIDRLRKTRDYGRYANDPEGWRASDLSGRLEGFEKDVFGQDYVDYGRNRLQARDLKALRDQQALTNQLLTPTRSLGQIVMDARTTGPARDVPRRWNRW